MMRLSIIVGIAAAVGACAAPGRPAWADAATAMTGGRIMATTGAGIYQHVCQGCHQPGGVGAVGAAAVPALANNHKLAAPAYPIYILLNGYGAMPWFNAPPELAGLTDAQIAAVVTYIRGHFGNSYTVPVTPAAVAALRGPARTPERY
jgi:mono/diheme cytochrome c family protein